MEKSCVIQRLERIEKWTEQLERGHSVDMIYLDFPKSLIQFHKRVIKCKYMFLWLDQNLRHYDQISGRRFWRLKTDFHLDRNTLPMWWIEKKFRCNWLVIGPECLKFSLRFELRTEWKIALR